MYSLCTIVTNNARQLCSIFEWTLTMTYAWLEHDIFTRQRWADGLNNISINAKSDIREARTILSKVGRVCTRKEGLSLPLDVGSVLCPGPADDWNQHPWTVVNQEELLILVGKTYGVSMWIRQGTFWWSTFDMGVGFDKIFQSGLSAGSFTLINNATYYNRPLRRISSSCSGVSLSGNVLEGCTAKQPAAHRREKVDDLRSCPHW